MARIEWVKLRLNNWALWKAREESGGLGFPAQASFLREASSGYRESIVPVDEVDAAVTDQAVEALKPDRVHLYETLHALYVDGVGIKAAARHFGKAESTIKAQLDQADRALSLWFSERASRRQQSFTP